MPHPRKVPFSKLPPSEILIVIVGAQFTTSCHYFSHILETALPFHFARNLEMKSATVENRRNN
jgi:hypothetical protein